MSLGHDKSILSCCGSGQLGWTQLADSVLSRTLYQLCRIGLLESKSIKVKLLAQSGQPPEVVPVVLNLTMLDLIGELDIKAALEGAEAVELEECEEYSVRAAA